MDQKQDPDMDMPKRSSEETAGKPTERDSGSGMGQGGGSGGSGTERDSGSGMGQGGGSQKKSDPDQTPQGQ
jgi:hypothetical protein